MLLASTARLRPLKSLRVICRRTARGDRLKPKGTAQNQKWGRLDIKENMVNRAEFKSARGTRAHQFTERIPLAGCSCRVRLKASSLLCVSLATLTHLQRHSQALKTHAQVPPYLIEVGEEIRNVTCSTFLPVRIPSVLMEFSCQTWPVTVCRDDTSSYMAGLLREGWSASSGR